MLYLFLAFVLVPILEIALFIQVGGVIGLWPTLAIVVLTAFAGTWLVRSQGQQEMNRLRKSLSDLNDPTEPLAHGAMVLLAGVLLLTPGFFTDAIGLLLLMPPVRVAVFRWLRARMVVTRFEMGPNPKARQNAPDNGNGRAEVIDGDYEVVNPKREPDSPPSGWVKGPERH
ncbi:FxsA family protein [Pontibaca salina]|uniref:FxsA family protein n=1 Tax=Pontibaca salina TaxID=2795731 RepID=A0A934M1B3_9RHOB|nr:FxsA family protein [Pontibaca salina]MBI6629486.1 FxsA family protein [Pontibaca salina]